MQLDFSYLLSNKIPRVVYYVCPNVVLIQEGTKSSQVLTRSEQLSSCTKKVNLLFHFLPFHRVAQNEKKSIYARCAFTAFTAQRKHLNKRHFKIICFYLPGFKLIKVKAFKRGKKCFSIFLSIVLDIVTKKSTEKYFIYTESKQLFQNFTDRERCYFTNQKQHPL